MIMNAKFAPSSYNMIPPAHSPVQLTSFTHDNTFYHHYAFISFSIITSNAAIAIFTIIYRIITDVIISIKNQNTSNNIMTTNKSSLASLPSTVLVT